MRRIAILSALLFALVPTPHRASAREPVPEQDSQVEPHWSARVGLAYLATSGNSDSETVGLDLEAKRRPAPWGLEVAAKFDRAEQDGGKTVERYGLGLRGTRALAERWDAFIGASGERDEFASIDLQAIVEVGAAYKALQGPHHILSLEVALSWTDEKRLPPATDQSWLGGLAGLGYEWAISDSADVSQRLRYFANFDDSGDWRADSVTAVTAALKRHLALRLSYEIRYRNEPIGDNDDADTTTKVSLVWSR